MGDGFASETRSTPWAARLFTGPLSAWFVSYGTALCVGVGAWELCLLLERLGAPEAGWGRVVVVGVEVDSRRVTSWGGSW
jgi:hypothetical protein